MVVPILGQGGPTSMRTAYGMGFNEALTAEQVAALIPATHPFLYMLEETGTGQICFDIPEDVPNNSRMLALIVAHTTNWSGQTPAGLSNPTGSTSAGTPQVGWSRLTFASGLQGANGAYSFSAWTRNAFSGVAGAGDTVCFGNDPVGAAFTGDIMGLLIILNSTGGGTLFFAGSTHAAAGTASMPTTPGHPTIVYDDNEYGLDFWLPWGRVSTVSGYDLGDEITELHHGTTYPLNLAISLFLSTSPQAGRTAVPSDIATSSVNNTSGTVKLGTL